MATSRGTGRRRFLALATGTTTLAGVGGFAAWRYLVVPKLEREVQPRSRAVPEPPAPTLVDTYQPRFDRIHSAAVYQAMATKSVAVALVEDRTESATVPAKMTTIELDAFFDDVITRESKLVLIGEHGGGLVGFCYRFLLDPGYPSIHAEDDGFGTPEFGKSLLHVLGSRYRLERLTDDAPPPRLDGETAWYRRFGDHDAALVYLPKPSGWGARATLGIADPVAAVEQTLANSSSLFGLEFVLMSPKSFEKMRARLAQQQTRLDIAKFVAGLAVTALVLVPLLGSGSAGVAIQSLAEPGRKLVARALPVAMRLGRDLLLQRDGFVAQSLGEQARVALLGVEFPVDDEIGFGLVQKFAAALVEQRGEAAQFVEFGDGDGRRVGQVFMPGSRMCLAAELLSRGLVRLDMNHREALLEFPELVTAALSAVEGRHELAGEWAQRDNDYVASLRALNRVVAG